MADQVHILNGDELDEQLLAEALGREGISDYVARDLIPAESDVDYANAVVDIPAGKAYILDNGRDSMLLPDARAGVQLATDGVNHVYIYYDLSQPKGERIGYHVDSDGTPPSQPSLAIAEIDMGAQEVRPQNDTAPIYRRDAITYKNNDIDSDGDGVVDRADEADLVQGGNVSGAVADAQDSQRLGGIPPTGWLRSDTANALGAAFTNVDGPALIERADTDNSGFKLAHVDHSTTGQPSIDLSVGEGTSALRARNSVSGSVIFDLFNYGGLNMEGSLQMRINDQFAALGGVRPDSGSPDDEYYLAQLPGVGKPNFNLRSLPYNDIALQLYDTTNDRVIWTVRHDGSLDIDGSLSIGPNDRAPLTDEDEQFLDVRSADSATTAQTAGQADLSKKSTDTERVRQLIRSPNVHIPIATLDAGESVMSPIVPTPYDRAEVWVWGVQTKGRSTDGSLTLRAFDNTGSNWGATSGGREVGDPASYSPVEGNARSNMSKIWFELTNNTGSPIDAGFYVGYYLRN